MEAVNDKEVVYNFEVPLTWAYIKQNVHSVAPR